MKLITRTTDYAIRALCYIAQQPDGCVCVPCMVKALHMPRPFLRKILQRLNRAGILKSMKGKGGGFVLAKRPDEITLVQLIILFQGKISLNECLFRKHTCPRQKNCNLKKQIDIIQEEMIQRLKQIRLSSLIKKEMEKP